MQSIAEYNGKNLDIRDNFFYIDGDIISFSFTSPQEVEMSLMALPLEKIKQDNEIYMEEGNGEDGFPAGCIFSGSHYNMRDTKILVLNISDDIIELKITSKHDENFSKKDSLICSCEFHKTDTKSDLLLFYYPPNK